ncbi:glycosyltransferase family 9 protein [Helicobacter ailurogastricus]|uniref:glycosyltransferase family 9 protein n=1 Tax=Helicobacter ailurogastricus TaxID=1578720 RepID=UPI000CF062EC|nr:glycosyltransferase family 9 protein [Helicobacter ailurogastricus]
MEAWVRLWLERAFYKFVCALLALQVRKPKIRPKTLLLIRLDALGDYVLFRNFLRPIREAYKDYEITFLCNSANLEIINAYDLDCVDELYPLKVPTWRSLKSLHCFSSLYHFLYSLYKLRQKGYEICISPVFTRRVFKEDLMMRAVHATHKIGSYGEMLSRCWHKANPTLQHHDKAYTSLLDASPSVLFEFERNREFCATLLNKNLDSVRLHMELPHSPPPPIKAPYGVFFIGAKGLDRQLSPDTWIALARGISSNFSLLLCGSSGEVKRAQEITQGVEGLINLVGQTSLCDLLHLLKGASFIVSHETAIPHFCMALGCEAVFVVSGGAYMGRFIPYPPSYTNYHVIYHPRVCELLACAHGIGRCMEIYAHKSIDLQIPHPDLPRLILQKMAKVNGEWIKDPTP